MAEKPVISPSIPYLGPLRNAVAPGNFIRIVGTVSSVGKEFLCNLQCGPSQFDDIALQILVNVNASTIVTKAQELGSWKEENSYANSPITRGQQFEILVICEPTVFKIGVNGQHLCEYPHKLPYHRISYLRIEGDLSVSLISVEKQLTSPSTAVDRSMEMNSAPPPYGVVTAPYPPAPYQPVPLQAVPPQAVPPQVAYPLNSGHPPQTIVYSNQPQPPGPYGYNALSQPNNTIVALNSTARPYQRPFFSRPNSRNLGRNMTLSAAFGVFIVLFTAMIIYVTAFP